MNGMELQIVYSYYTCFGTLAVYDMCSVCTSICWMLEMLHCMTLGHAGGIYEDADSSSNTSHSRYYMLYAQEGANWQVYNFGLRRHRCSPFHHIHTHRACCVYCVTSGGNITYSRK